PDPTPVPTPDPDEEVTVPETEGGSVEVEPVPAGETATVVCEPEPGQEVREVVVTDSEGNRVETTTDEDGNVTFEMPEGGATVEVVFGCDGGELCGTHAFPDIDQDEWYHDSVDWAIGAGVFHGYDDGTFGPDDVLTREQAAAVLYNYLGGAPGAPGSGLSDVSEDWYTDAVNWAVANGVMTGYEGAGAFGVGDALTREQFCSVVAKAMGADLEGVDASVLDGFSDADSVSGWARSAVAWAVEAGVVNGVENPDGTRSLQGARDITRAEMAAMMKNAVDAGVLATA
ncbi:S-layer homology domain-containing protein, partial [Collinsella tanakaei]|nr:S-layer homology domain-containing protein [Collinsella tanakaei]